MRKASWLSALSVVVSGMVYGSIAGMERAAAASVDVTVDNIEYSVTDESTSFTTDEQTLENQPWWGNEATADEFALDVAGDLGYPNYFGSDDGPLFAFAPYGDEIDASEYFVIQYGGEAGDELADPDSTYYYAVATVIPSTPEPAPTAGVVLAVGLGVALRCRRRTVKQKGE